ENGVPTEFYDRLRDPNDWKYVLGERMRELYADLFAIDANVQSAPDHEVNGAISRVTGKDTESVKRYHATFKTLASLARFDPKPGRESHPDKAPENATPADIEHPSTAKRSREYHYNIQIHLPVTTDITVYNAIFKSLQEHLGV